MYRAMIDEYTISRGYINISREIDKKRGFYLICSSFEDNIITSNLSWYLVFSLKAMGHQLTESLFEQCSA